MILIAAAASGAMFALALPPFNIEILGWFCFAPLLVVAAGLRRLESLGLAIVAGLTAGVIQVGRTTICTGDCECECRPVGRAGNAVHEVRRRVRLCMRRVVDVNLVDFKPKARCGRAIVAT